MFDALIVGAGPAGCSTAIALADAGWSVALVEKAEFPRRKVCGECIAASNLPLLDALGVGAEFAALAGPPLTRVALVSGHRWIEAALPAMADPVHRHGRALGREHLDTLLRDCVVARGVTLYQPWQLKAIERSSEGYRCRLQRAHDRDHRELRATLLIRAHGSWEPAPGDDEGRGPPHDGDLLAFKHSVIGGGLEPGVLPVLAFPGGYGGMVLGDHGVTTIAFCLRRDALRQLRQLREDPESSRAFDAALQHVKTSCPAVGRVLDGATPAGPPLAVGPLRTGRRALRRADGSFAVGNAAGEAHPILGEGISMALQSGWMLAGLLSDAPEVLRADAVGLAARSAVGHRYARAWTLQFVPRLTLAASCAHLAMTPALTPGVLPLLRRWPGLLGHGARWAGKLKAPARLPPSVLSRG